MPSSYAHYRFGTQIIPLLPADVRGPVLRHRALFDTGLHGPDFLFFHSFIKKTPLYLLGITYHEQSGRDFFTNACANLQQAPSEGAFAYLLGVLAHYCLDKHCHPLVYALTDDAELGHAELETEFDRFLLSLDGFQKPREVNILRYIKLKAADYAAISGFYPDASPKDVALCIRNMELARSLLALPTKAGYGAVTAFVRIAGGNTAGQAMSIDPNPTCAHLNPKLMELYGQAINKFPDLLEQLNHHLAYGEPFGDDFKENFNRG